MQLLLLQFDAVDLLVALMMASPPVLVILLSKSFRLLRISPSPAGICVGEGTCQSPVTDVVGGRLAN